MSKAHFFNKEDADRHSKKYGGKVHDNTHNNKPWNGNNYTVSDDNSSNEIDSNVLYDIEEPEFTGHVTMSKEDHENWMKRKGWSEQLKERHRDEFERCDKNSFGEINMWFNGSGSFIYD